MKEQFVNAIAPSKFGDLLEAGLDFIPFGGAKKKEEEDSERDDNKSGSDCGHEEIDLGDGPVDWIFDPEKLRDLFHHGNKKFGVEEKDAKDWIQ